MLNKYRYMYNINSSFISRRSHWMLIARFRLLTPGFLQAMGSTDTVPPLGSCVVRSDWCVSILLLSLFSVLFLRLLCCFVIVGIHFSAI